MSVFILVGGGVSLSIDDDEPILKIWDGHLIKNNKMNSCKKVGEIALKSYDISQLRDILAGMDGFETLLAKGIKPKSIQLHIDPPKKD
jgi:hypothetical protein|tara:strand:- start:74 stop:337 length:264 start_codon:yes stop_codon:yes gene_type:complete